MLDSKLDHWILEEEEDEEKFQSNFNETKPEMSTLSEEEAGQPTPKKPASVELLKEERVGEIKVVLRRNAKLKYLEVRAISLIGKSLDSGRGFAQYLPTWHNEYCNGPQLAEAYFQALVAWVRGGRKGSILPFDYPEEE